MENLETIGTFFLGLGVFLISIGVFYFVSVYERINLKEKAENKK